MHDEHATARGGDRIDETEEAFPFVVVVHAEPAFHRHRRVRRGGDHRGDTVGDQRRFAHQTGAETPGLHAIRRTSAVEIDFVEAVLGADVRRLREQRRIAAAELQRHRMLGVVFR